MIDLVHQRPHDPLQHAEVQNEEAFGINGALHCYPDPVVVAVERLALVASKSDEMGRGEDEVILTDFDPKLALHRDALSLSASHTSR